MSLRVTHLFRKEQGEWKLLHRHADPLMSKTAPAAVLRADERQGKGSISSIRLPNGSKTCTRYEPGTPSAGTIS